MSQGIASLNRQDVPAYPRRVDSAGAYWDWEGVEPDKLPYVCDCCRKHVAVQPLAMYSSDPWDAGTMNPRLVEVAGVTYYGCSTECARILFDVHHRYAQLRGEQKEPR